MSLGYQHQAYDDQRFGTVGEIGGKFALNWNPTRLTSVTGTFVHEYVEDIFGASPGYVHNQYGVHVDHELRRDLLLSEDISFDARSLLRLTRDIDIVRYENRLQYQLSDGFSINAIYDFSHQSGTENTSSYDHNIFTLRMEKQF